MATSTETANGDTANYALNLLVTVVPTTVTSPLVIDLNGDGVQTTALGNTTGRFDLLNNGHALNSGWISAQDGFLAIDTNGNGRIDDRNELFGGEIGEGFNKLASFDTNHDGVVNAQDARSNELKIWQDANGNHQTDAGELRSLADFGINGVNVNNTIVPEQQNGNWLLERSTVTFKDGHTAQMADAYFELGRPESKPAQGSSASITLRSEQAQNQDQPKLILGFPNDGKAINWKGRDQVAPKMDWNAKPDTSILSDDSDSNKKSRKAKPGWVSSFIGAEKETKQDAASLSKLSVKLKGKE